MKRLVFAAAVTAIGLSYATGLQAQTGDQIPPIAGGYTNVTAIPVNDPTIKAISGALFKPPGAGPFPAVVYMIGCSGIDSSRRSGLRQKVATDHLLAKGVAIRIVDPFTPRNEPTGVCAKLMEKKQPFSTLRAAAMTLWRRWLYSRRCLQIDAKHIFLVGFSLEQAFRRCLRPI